MRSDARATALLLAGPAALIGGALAFQYLGGLHPCEMCMWQRYAVLATLALALAAWASGHARVVQLLAVIALLVNAGLGVFHAGVEQHWWQGITRCAATPASGPTSAIIADIMAQPFVRCDAIPWSLAGISMAGWNAISSFVLAGVALWLINQSRTTR